MSGVESAVIAAGKAIAERAVREWLSARGAREQRAAELKELVQSAFRDRILRRRFDNQVEGIALAVEDRLRALVEQEFRGLEDHDRAAVLMEVVDGLRRADLSDAAVLGADGDAVRLAERVRAALPPPRLGEAQDRLYEVLLAESLECLVRMIQQLPQFLPRAAAETLSRLSGLAEQVERLLARMPVRTLEAPEGRQDDAAFERRYLDHVSRVLDQVELFGVRVESFRPRTSLSVAYISLSVSTAEPGKAAAPPPLASLTGRHEPDPATLRIEAALGRSRLTLLRGEAGSGKSTLLRWLAVTAARGAFSGELAGWNGCVPLMVKLRSHADGRLPGPDAVLDDVAQEIAGLAPRAWAERVLLSGRGLLLVDGVDELLVRHRPAVRQWLSRMLAAYPGTRVVVTSRPAAAEGRWLADEGFAACQLEPMTPGDLRELVRQWHLAMRDCPSLPCEPDELDGYEGALLARLESNAHLRVLATTPLLAGMLCALNLDRRKQLPRSRMGLYDAVLGMLLERRDAERGITDDIVLDPEQKVWILRDLAWRLVSMGRSELSKATALKRVGQRLGSMTRMPYRAEEVVEHLLRRSGVLREPVPGRIDFAHKTVQEYLAAGQLADDEDVEAAVERAHLDQWREVVIMAAGHATGRLRHELLAGLLDRAAREPRHARRLRLLVASCLETIQEIPVELRDRVEECLAAVIPPRNEDEARMLAAAGEEILRRLPRPLEGVPDRAAAMAVRTAWLVNGPASLDLLAAYAPDGRDCVNEALQEGWRFYDPEEYARRVLALAPRLWLGVIGDPWLLPGLRHLDVQDSLLITAPVTDLGFLDGLRELRSLQLYELGTAELDPLRRLPLLESLFLFFEGLPAVDFGAFPELGSLRELSLWGTVSADGLGFLDRFAGLRKLGLEVPDGGLSSLSRALEALALDCRGQAFDPRSLAGVTGLTTLLIEGAADIAGSVAEIAALFPGLQQLGLTGTAGPAGLDALERLPLSWLELGGPWVTDLDWLPDGPSDLTVLRLIGTAVADLRPLAGTDRLTLLYLERCDQVKDLSPLARLTGLETLHLRDMPDTLDLAPLAGLDHLTVHRT
ncbi:NACHT domain-containing protein [Nonomuraea sp. NPDC003727]